MFCVNCFYPHTQVTNSRPHKKTASTWRRRKCSQCLKIFTTYERPSLADNKPVHLDDGKTEIFNLGKLTLSVAAAFSHSHREAQYNALWLAQTIEDELSTQYATITNLDIASCAHKVLKQYDELAALQYAAKHQLVQATRKKRGRPSIKPAS